MEISTKVAHNSGMNPNFVNRLVLSTLIVLAILNSYQEKHVIAGGGSNKITSNNEQSKEKEGKKQLSSSEDSDSKCEQDTYDKKLRDIKDILNSLYSASDAKSIVLSMLHDAIQVQRKNSVITPNLPHTRPRREYILAFQKLGEELSKLDSIHAHDSFFSDYAEQLLIAMKFFSDERAWPEVPHPGEEKFDKLFNKSEIEKVKGEIPSYHDPDFLERLKLNDQQLWEKFYEEIKEVRNSKRANYEWFIVFTTRLSFLSTPERYRSKSFFKINTGYASYASLIDYLQVWRQQEAMKEFMAKVGDRYTTQMSSPLALAHLFPHIAIVPYPFSLDESELLELHPWVKSQFDPNHNSRIAPIGFSFSPTFADGSLHYPFTFMMHDYQHLAIWRGSYSAIQADSPLSPTQIEMIQDYFKNGIELLTSAIGELAEKIKKIDDPEQRKFFSAILFYIAHEQTGSVISRLEELDQPVLVKEDRIPPNYFLASIVGKQTLSKLEKMKIKDRYLNYARKFQSWVLTNLNPQTLDKIERWNGVNGKPHVLLSHSKWNNTPLHFNESKFHPYNIFSDNGLRTFKNLTPQETEREFLFNELSDGKKGKSYFYVIPNLHLNNYLEAGGVWQEEYTF